MGQQSPYQGYPSGAYGNPNAGMLPPGLVPSQNGSPFPYPGNAQMQQAILDSLNNPNGGDSAQFTRPPDMLAMGEEMGFFPKPIHALYGALGGIGISAALEKLYSTPPGGKEHHLAVELARKFDRLPGVRHVSDFLEKHVSNRVAAGVGDIKDKSLRRYMEHATTRLTPQAAEKYMVNEVLGRLRPTLTTEANRELKNLLTKSAGPDDAIKALEAMMAKGQKAEAEILAKAFGKMGKDVPKELAEKLANAKSLKHADKIINNKGLFRRLGLGRTKLDPAQKEVLLTALKKAKLEGQVYSRVRGAYNRIKGLQSHYFPVYKTQHALNHTLKKQGVGPIGRFLADMGNNIRRIFSGNTLAVGKDAAAQTATKEGSSILGRVFGPALMGAFIVGQSFTEASKAEKGDKLSSFFHDFLGFGVGNFLGWEVGRRLLNKYQVFPKIFGALKKGHWLEKIVIKLPKFLGRVPVIGPWAAGIKYGITLGGFLTEMVAMFGVGSLFQKAGEWISHRIFGKPKKVQKEELEAQGIVQAMGSEPGQPLNRIGRFSGMDMNLDTRPAHPANVPLDPRSGTPLSMPQVNVPQFTLSPDQIMQSPTRQAFEDFENSVEGL